jgi:16S rRNA (cytosine1402-N4)-methyltransferase
MSNLQLALPGLLAADSSTEWVWRDDFDEVSDVKRFEHTTVMRDEVARALAPRAGGIYVDATLGGGGHTVALLEAEPKARIVGMDRDPAAIAAAEEWLAPVADRVTLVRSTFSRVRAELDALGIGQVDGIVADLGVSSPQLDEPERGMSFRREGPLDMRMDPENGETALELIDRLSDDELADVIFQYGEERRSRRIARSIKKALASGELKTTLDLRRATVRAVGPARVGGVDPATRTFQALRIAVNRELEELAPRVAGRRRRDGGRGRPHQLPLARGPPREARFSRRRLAPADEEAGDGVGRRAAAKRAIAQREAPCGAAGRSPGGRRMSRPRPAFLAVWTLAIAGTASAFVVHLALRGRTVELGYDLGHARQEQSRLREVKRVLELESASYKTPERVEIVARTLLGMEPPPPERIVPLASTPSSSDDDDRTARGTEGPP